MNPMIIPHEDIDKLLANNINEVFFTLESQFKSPITEEMIKKINSSFIDDVIVEYSVDLFFIAISSNCKLSYKLSTYQTSERFNMKSFRFYEIEKPEEKVLNRIFSAKIGFEELWIFTKPLIEEMKKRGFYFDEKKLSAFLSSVIKKISFVKLSDSELEKKKAEERLNIRRTKIQKNYVDFITKDSLSQPEISTFNNILDYVSSIIVSDGIDQLEDDDYMVAYIELMLDQFAKPIKLAYYCGVKDGFDSRLEDKDVKNKRLHIFHVLIENLKIAFLIEENNVSEFLNNKCQWFTIKRKPVVGITEAKDFIKAEQLFAIHIADNIKNAILKFEDNTCFVLLNDGTLYTVTSIENVPDYARKAYDWLINQGLLLPETVLFKYIGKGDFASPLFFKRK